MPRKRINGEGTISQRGDGRWQAIYTRGVRPDGKPDRRWIYGKTAAEVSEKLSKALASLRDGSYVEPGRITVGQWLDVWLRDYVKRPGAKLSTAGTYEDIIEHRVRPYLGGYKLQKLTGDRVQRWVNELTEAGYASASVRGAHRVLSCALVQAVRNRMLNYNAAQYTILPKLVQAEKKALTQEEQARLVAALPEDSGGRALAFILHTGLRIGECCALSWDDVRGDMISIRRTVQRTRNYEGGSKTAVTFDTPKSDASVRDIPLTAEAQAILARQRAWQVEESLKMGRPLPEWVFANGAGGVLEASHVTKVLYRACDAIGIDHRGPHTLRHTFGTRLNERGVDANTIAKLMGHSNPAITMQTYIHTDEQQLRRAIGALERPV